MPTSLMFACLRRREQTGATRALLAGAWSLVDDDPHRDDGPVEKIRKALFESPNHCFACIWTVCRRKSLEKAFASPELGALHDDLQNPIYVQKNEFELVQEACELATDTGSHDSEKYTRFLKLVEMHEPEKNNEARVWFRTLVAPLFPRTVARKMIALYCQQQVDALGYVG